MTSEQQFQEIEILEEMFRGHDMTVASLYAVVKLVVRHALQEERDHRAAQ